MFFAAISLISAKAELKFPDPDGKTLGYKNPTLNVIRVSLVLVYAYCTPLYVYCLKKKSIINGTHCVVA